MSNNNAFNWLTLLATVAIAAATIVYTSHLDRKSAKREIRDKYIYNAYIDLGRFDNYSRYGYVDFEMYMNHDRALRDIHLYGTPKEVKLLLEYIKNLDSETYSKAIEKSRHLNSTKENIYNDSMGYEFVKVGNVHLHNPYLNELTKELRNNLRTEFDIEKSNIMMMYPINKRIIDRQILLNNLQTFREDTEVAPRKFLPQSTN